MASRDILGLKNRVLDWLSKPFLPQVTQKSHNFFVFRDIYLQLWPAYARKFQLSFELSRLFFCKLQAKMAILDILGLKVSFLFS